ncbi:MAG: hypothetical protein KKD28_08140, partial [Chloroflexi bacterium]|nr:hypothetical protein [Chloroflexota bacterium]
MSLPKPIAIVLKRSMRTLPAAGIANSRRGHSALLAMITIRHGVLPARVSVCGGNLLVGAMAFNGVLLAVIQAVVRCLSSFGSAVRYLGKNPLPTISSVR